MFFKWMQFKSYILSFLFSLAKCTVSIYSCIEMTPVPCIFSPHKQFIVFRLWTAIPQKEVTHFKWRVLIEIIFLRKIITSFSNRKCKKFHFIMILQPPSILNICSCSCLNIYECSDFSRHPDLLSWEVFSCSWLTTGKVDKQYADLFFGWLRALFLFLRYPFCKSPFIHLLRAS